MDDTIIGDACVGVRKLNKLIHRQHINAKYPDIMKKNQVVSVENDIRFMQKISSTSLIMLENCE